MVSISKKVFNKIKEDKIKMRPKIFFALKTFLFSLLTLLLIIFVIYLFSFLFFHLKMSGVWFLPKFGFSATGILIKSLPWLLILTVVVSVIILEIFIKRFSFAYRRPIIYSVIGIVLFALLSSFVIGKAQIHPNLFWQAQEKKLPMVGKIYRNFGMPKLPQVHYGIISEKLDNGFILENPQGEKITVSTELINQENMKEFKEGDNIIIIGKKDNNNIYSANIRKIEENFEIFQKRPLHKQMHFNR